LVRVKSRPEAAPASAMRLEKRPPLDR
jgi:hypothetical protein